LDPRKVFHDRKLHQILRDLTDALEHPTSHSPVTTSFSTSEKGQDKITLSLPEQDSSSIQLLNLEFICAPGKSPRLFIYTIWRCLVLSCLVLSCLVLSCLIKSSLTRIKNNMVSNGIRFNLTNTALWY
jgi:hypothetical protein